MVDDFLNLVSGADAAGEALTSISHSVESHLVALAAEKSRLEEGAVVTLNG